MKEEIKVEMKAKVLKRRAPEESKEEINQLVQMYVSKDEPVDVMIKRIEADFLGKKDQYAEGKS